MIYVAKFHLTFKPFHGGQLCECQKYTVKSHFQHTVNFPFNWHDGAGIAGVQRHFEAPQEHIGGLDRLLHMVDWIDY